MKSIELTSILPSRILRHDTFVSKAKRCRYLLQGPDGYFTEENGSIVQTAFTQKATAFVDVLVAAQKGQILMAHGHLVQSVTPVTLP